MLCTCRQIKIFHCIFILLSCLQMAQTLKLKGKESRHYDTGLLPDTSGDITKRLSMQIENYEKKTVFVRLNQKIVTCRMLRHILCAPEPWQQPSGFSDMFDAKIVAEFYSIPSNTHCRDIREADAFAALHAIKIYSHIRNIKTFSQVQTAFTEAMERKYLYLFYEQDPDQIIRIPTISPSVNKGIHKIVYNGKYDENNVDYDEVIGRAYMVLSSYYIQKNRKS